MIKPLTSLRFFFALIVLMVHFSINNKPMFENGFMGVGFFFMLSGFILSFSYYDRISKVNFNVVREFYIARLARIYPLHLLSLLLMLLVSLPMILKQSIMVNLSTFFSNLFLLQSWIPAETYYFSYNSPAWSISNEIFFYLLFPFIVMLVSSLNRNGKIVLFLFTILTYVLILNLWIADLPYDIRYFNIYINPLFRLIEFIIGVFLFLFWHSLKESKELLLNLILSRLIFSTLELCSIILLVLFSCYSGSFQLIYTWDMYYWLPMAFILIVFAFSKGVISQLLSNRFFVYLGEISFGFYMFHWIVLYLMAVFKKLIGITMVWQTEFALVLVSTLVVSHLSFKYFEKPLTKKVKLLLSRCF
jgi:peptidoglycan/LPS O-acetylase OafA/YrhL